MAESTPGGRRCGGRPEVWEAASKWDVAWEWLEGVRQGEWGDGECRVCRCGWR